MIKRYWAKTIMLACAVALGCGGATEAPQKRSSIARGSDAPFGGAGDAADLKTASSSSSEKETYDASDLRVPGSKWGIKGSMAGSAKKCPKGKRGKKCRANRRGRVPVSAAISEQMEGIPWGMHYKAVLARFEDRIREKYKDQLKNADGAVEEDRIRTNMMREIGKLKKSFVKFDGQRTGFEGDMVEKEFTHNNGESMLRWDAGKYLEYMFFFNGRFWKRIRSFRKDSFSDDITFEIFVSTLINRFGNGKEIFNDMNALTEVKWQNKNTYLSAYDKSGFYGVYCLDFVAKATQDNLSKLRTNRGRGKGKAEENVSSMVTSVTSGGLSDKHTSVIDSYTDGNTGSSEQTVDIEHSVTKKRGKPAEEKKDKAKSKEKEDDDNLDIF